MIAHSAHPADSPDTVSPHAPLPRPREQPHAGGGAAEVVSDASHRLRALAALSGSLTDALGPE